MRIRTSLLLMYMSQAGSLLTVFFAAWLIAQRLGEASFAEYSLFRRGAVFATMLAGLGISVAAPRMLADRIIKNKSEPYLIPKNVANEYGVALFLLAVVFMIIALALQPKTLSILLVGKQANVSYGYSIIIFVLAFYSYLYVFELLRIMNKFYTVFVLQMGYFVLIPILTIFFFKNLSTIILVTVSLSLIWAIIFIPYMFHHLSPATTSIEKQSALQTILNFISYAPIPLIILSLFSVPAFLVLHVTGKEVTAGYMAFSASLVSAAGQVITPINLVLRGRLRFMHSSNTINNKKVLLKWWNWGTLLVVIISFFIFIVLFLIGDKIIDIYFFPINISYENKQLIMFTLFSIPGYLLYLSCFGFVEAMSTKNNKIIIAVFSSLLVLVIGIILNYIYPLGAIGFSIAQVISFSVLGLLMYFFGKSQVNN